MTTPVSSLSVSAEVIIDLHSLNNEGGEGNQVQTRQVEVVFRDEMGDPRIESVNAISGDMFKHIQAEHLFRLAQNNDQLKLCNACAEFNANRISGDPEFIQYIKEKNPGSVALINYMLQHCTIDDLEGILITEGKQSVPRKSVVEFGWVVGRPESTRTNQHFHVKYNPSKPGKDEIDRKDETGNQGQAIFYRPVNSGVYALVSHLEIARIGYNDINKTYAIDEDERQQRYTALLRSMLHTFVRPAGAMRSAQLPHLVDIRGVIAWSTGPVPAPTFSALNPDFMESSEQIAATLNTGYSDPVVSVQRFESFAMLGEQLAALLESTHPMAYTKR